MLKVVNLIGVITCRCNAIIFQTTLKRIFTRCAFLFVDLLSATKYRQFELIQLFFGCRALKLLQISLHDKIILKNNSLASKGFQRIFKNILKKVGNIFALSKYIIVYLHINKKKRKNHDNKIPQNIRTSRSNITR